MSIILPSAIAGYFAADKQDAATVAQYFTENALVVDEQKTHRGRAAIYQWKAETSSKYSYISEPISIAHNGEIITVISRLTGNFPGSPIDLSYAFILENNTIARLEIGV
ncbi:nuclear transport factor 2 family protein [Rouxiella sp. Mn2063]|uniref:nuclear transport factor 2 family protein n=1 Tax=Rouxiella sp. Mn2063 TaxID=3395262 RepID=UPI003BE772E9